MRHSDTVNIILADYDNPRLMDLFTRVQSANPILRVVAICQTGQDLIERASTMKEVDVILMDFNLLDKTAIEIARELKELSPETEVFAISDVMSAEFIFSAKNKGVAEVIKRENLVARDVANRIVDHVVKKREEYEKLAAEHGAVEIGSKNKQIVKEYIAKTVKDSIILTYNTKGGVGKSTIAANLATSIKISPFYSGKRVVLVDFDCGGANVSTLTEIPDMDTISKNLANWSDVDPASITPDEVDSLLIPGPHGLMIAPAPLNYILARKVGIDIAENVLKSLKKFFDVIIIDGAPNISPLVDAAMQHATHILLIANPEGQSVKQLSRIVQYLEKVTDEYDKDLSYILNKMFVLLNHAQKPSKYDLDANEVARTIGRPLMREVPNSELVKKALHSRSNKQAVELESDSDFAVAIKKLANDVCGAYPEGFKASKEKEIKKEKKKGLFKMFKK